jgi:hypothetical protein
MSVLTSRPPTGTYSFSPSSSDLVLYAYSLCGIRRTELTQTHLIDAAIASNLVMVNLSNSLPLQWALGSQDIELIEGTATYDLDASTVIVPIVTVSTASGGLTMERVIGPLSAYEYAALPNKGQKGAPTSYFYKLGATPTITLWPTPDGADDYTLVVTSYRQLQDVDLTNVQGPDLVYRFLDVYVTELAARLAESYKPEKADKLYALAEARLVKAQGRDQETVNMSISFPISSYYRV